MQSVIDMPHGDYSFFAIIEAFITFNETVIVNKNKHGQLETDSMSADIGCGFIAVPFELHLSMYSNYKL